MKKRHIIKQLESIMDSILKDANLPHARGKTIRISNYIIRQNKFREYVIVDLEHNTTIAKTNFKNCAIAIVKNLVDGKNVLNKVSSLDQLLLKHSNDVKFYQHSIKTTTDKFVREVREIRLDFSLSHADYIRNQIDDIIFNN